MKVGFDLDGTLDKPALAALALTLAADNNEVHIITGIFDEAGEWQSLSAKRKKLERLGFYRASGIGGAFLPNVYIHPLMAVDKSFPLDYRLRDLGLRKGELCERLGIEVMFDDSELYCTVMKCMAGGLTILQVK